MMAIWAFWLAGWGQQNVNTSAPSVSDADSARAAVTLAVTSAASVSDG